MAQRVSGYDRVADDRYETPKEITATIIPYLRRMRVRRAWEPAHAPDDKLGNALRAAGFKVTSTAGDFLAAKTAPRGVDALVTNPPYGKQGKLAEAFIRHALDLKVPHVALLLPVDFDSALTRAQWFGDCGAFNGKIILLRRIKWFPGDSGPSTNHAWFLWRRAGAVSLIRYATPVKPHFLGSKARLGEKSNARASHEREGSKISHASGNTSVKSSSHRATDWQSLEPQ
jgi:hypothetical protein